MTLFPATGPQAGISAPSSRRGQTEAAIGHLRFEGDMGRELPRSIWEQKLSTNLTLYKAYINHWTNLRRAETKRKKEFNLEDWEKETSNTII